MPAKPISPANARSRRTRQALLDAARALLEGQGSDALTMSAVADRAGVTRRTAYIHFGSRADLVALLFDHVAEAEGLAESIGRVRDAPDAVAALDEWAAHLARYHTRVVALDRAIARAADSDPDAARYRSRIARAKLKNCRDLVRRLDDEGVLGEQWRADTATDVLYALTSSDVVDGLTGDRGWSKEKLARSLAVLFRAALLDPSKRQEDA
jgi:AcrR family transcriptional regulator